MRAPAVPSVLLLAAAVAWTLVLATGLPQRGGVAVVLIALSLWIGTVAAVTGMLVAHARWARRLALGVTGAQSLVALAAETSPLWAAALLASAAAAVGVGGPWLDGHIRRRPSASGPPARAVLVPLLLIAVPLAVGLAGGDDGWAVTAALAALMAAFWYIRAFPGAVLAVRVLWPALALATAWPLGWPAGVVTAALAVLVAVLSWHPSVRAAVIRLEERGSLVPIPPELVAPEILDAARIDRRGRPR